MPDRCLFLRGRLPRPVRRRRPEQGRVLRRRRPRRVDQLHILSLVLRRDARLHFRMRAQHLPMHAAVILRQQQDRPWGVLRRNEPRPHHLPHLLRLQLTVPCRPPLLRQLLHVQHERMQDHPGRPVRQRQARHRGAVRQGGHRQCQRHQLRRVQPLLPQRDAQLQALQALDGELPGE